MGKEVTGMNYYERRLDAEKYCYFVKVGANCFDDENKNIGKYVHFHKNVQFLFLKEGQITLQIGGENLEIKQGQIVFIDSLEPHVFFPDKIDGYLLVLGVWYVDAFKTLFADKRLPRIMGDNAKNQQIFEFVEKWHNTLPRVESEEMCYDTFLKANQLFKLLKNGYGVVSKSEVLSDVAISSILAFVNDHFQENITIKEIASKLGYAKEYCSQIFNRYMGESFRKYLNRKRIEKFQQLYLLKKDNVSVAEISKECGFECQATFYRAYKQIYGKTPKNKKL